MRFGKSRSFGKAPNMTSSMSKRTWKLYLADMLASIEKALSYVAGLRYEDFLGDSKTQDAVVRNLEVLSEAAHRIPAEVQKKHPQIPWSQIISMRNRLIHGYFAVDPEIVWTIVTNELPELRKHLEAVQQEEVSVAGNGGGRNEKP